MTARIERLNPGMMHWHGHISAVLRLDQRGHITDSCLKKMQIRGSVNRGGQIRPWVPGKELEEVVEESDELKSGGSSQQSTTSADSSQSGRVDPFEDSVDAVDMPDT